MYTLGKTNVKHDVKFNITPNWFKCPDNAYAKQSVESDIHNTYVLSYDVNFTGCHSSNSHSNDVKL